MADMLAQHPSFSKSTGRYVQSFTKKPDGASGEKSFSSETVISTNERVVISAQDGTGWAIAMGRVTDVLPGLGVTVALDKAVSCAAGVLYRIDQLAGQSGGIAYSNLAEICAPDSDRLGFAQLNSFPCMHGWVLEQANLYT